MDERSTPVFVGGGGLGLLMAGFTSPGLGAAGMGTPRSLSLGGITKPMEKTKETETMNEVCQ